MTSLMDIFKRKYKANVWCNNCKTHSEVMIPKGVTASQFIQSGSCVNCGCVTLVQDYEQIKEFKKPQVEPAQPPMIPRRPRPLPRLPSVPAEQQASPEIPEPRPTNQFQYEGEGRVFRKPNPDYPFKRGARPRNNHHDPSDPNWWTGEGLDEQKI